MTSKNRKQTSGEERRYTVLENKELRMSKRNQDAIRVIKRLRGKLG